MGVTVKLVMVGPYQGKDKKIKNVDFKAGIAFVRGPEDKIMHILKYLRGYGAYPANEAVAAQKQVDDYLASQKDSAALAKRKLTLKIQMEELEKLEAVSATSSVPTAAPPGEDPAIFETAAEARDTDTAPPAEAPPAEATPTEGATDGTVPNQETEGRSGKKGNSGKTSGRHGRRNG